MSVGIKFRYNPAPLQQKLRSVRGAVSTTRQGPVRTGQDFAAERFIQFLRRRFTRFSKGGGDWAPLSPTTIARRRAEGFRGRRILFVRGRLYNAFRIGSALTLKRIANGFRIAWSRTRYGKIGSYQDGGTANIPAREMLVRADEPTLRGMRRDVEDGYRLAVKDAMAKAN